VRADLYLKNWTKNKLRNLLTGSEIEKLIAAINGSLHKA
jgi:hypothetical protein